MGFIFDWSDLLCFYMCCSSISVSSSGLFVDVVYNRSMRLQYKRFITVSIASRLRCMFQSELSVRGSILTGPYHINMCLTRVVCSPTSVSSPGLFVDVVYAQRMRTAKDRKRILSLFASVFGHEARYDLTPTVRMNHLHTQVGRSWLARRNVTSCNASEDIESKGTL